MSTDDFSYATSRECDPADIELISSVVTELCRFCGTRDVLEMFKQVHSVVRAAAMNKGPTSINVYGQKGQGFIYVGTLPFVEMLAKPEVMDFMAVNAVLAENLMTAIKNEKARAPRNN